MGASVRNGEYGIICKFREIHEISLGAGNDIMSGCSIFVCDKQKNEHPELVENIFRTANGDLIHSLILDTLDSGEASRKEIASIIPFSY